MTAEPDRPSFRALCDRIRAMDPGLARGSQLEQLVHDLELLEASTTEERARVLVRLVDEL